MDAVKAATTTIPVVMLAIPDPVKAGFVASLGRPGGNITGLSNLSVDFGKRIEALRAVKPSLSRVALLVNPDHPNHPAMVSNTELTAKAIGTSVSTYTARDAKEIDAAIAAMTRQGAEAVIVLPDAFFSNQRAQIIDRANASRLPTMFWTRELVEAGGLLSYGQNSVEHFRLAATYTDKILKGARPADLPVEQPVKVELVVNRTTAKKIGLALPQSLLAPSKRSLFATLRRRLRDGQRETRCPRRDSGADPMLRHAANGSAATRRRAF
jgi:putative ABC transport system substrate-binding protein